MELFFILSIGMSMVALLPIALNELQLLTNQQNQASSDSIILQGVESTFPSDSLLMSTNAVNLIPGESSAVLLMEAEGDQRTSRTVHLASQQGQSLKSAV